MGCSPPTTQKTIKVLGEEVAYRVVVQNPSSSEPHEFVYPSTFRKLSLTTLMNYLSFDVKFGQQIDGNFISKYNPKEDKHTYYIQRLVGVPIENEKDPNNGKIWVVYVNSQKHFWNEVCNNDLCVNFHDSIVWVFQHPSDSITLDR